MIFQRDEDAFEVKRYGYDDETGLPVLIYVSAAGSLQEARDSVPWGLRQLLRAVGDPVGMVEAWVDGQP